MPIWAVLLLLLICSVASWMTGALMLSTFIYSRLARRVGRAQADHLLRPEGQ